MAALRRALADVHKSRYPNLAMLGSTLGVKSQACVASCNAKNRELMLHGLKVRYSLCSVSALHSQT